MKLIIAGGRDFNDNYSLITECDALRKFRHITEIVTGGARGADSLGKIYAKENGIPHKEFKAKWDLYGKIAGPKRNEQMAKYADILIAFWDGKSKGTQNMIEFAKVNKLEIYVIKKEA